MRHSPEFSVIPCGRHLFAWRARSEQGISTLPILYCLVGQITTTTCREKRIKHLLGLL